MTALHDMHCHLDFMANGEEVAAAARTQGTLLFANTVTPEGYQAARDRFCCFDNVIVGFGMHPWWAANARAGEDAPRQAKSQRAEHRRLVEGAKAARAASRAASSAETKSRCDAMLEMLHALGPAVIGEVGLDFGWRHLASQNEQLALFTTIVRWATAQGDKLISLHSIKAARETLDVLEREGALDSCRCIFHWFSGPSDLLKRAIDAGCFFSCGPRMLATGKGREYVKAIPASQLLLETDAPPAQGDSYSYASLRTELESAAASITAIKGEAAIEAITRTAERLLR